MSPEAGKAGILRPLVLLAAHPLVAAIVVGAVVLLCLGGWLAGKLRGTDGGSHHAVGEVPDTAPRPPD